MMEDNFVRHTESIKKDTMHYSDDWLDSTYIKVNQPIRHKIDNSCIFSRENKKDIEIEILELFDINDPHIDQIHHSNFKHDIDILEKCAILTRNLKIFINKKSDILGNTVTFDNTVDNKNKYESIHYILSNLEWLCNALKLLAHRNNQQIEEIKKSNSSNKNDIIYRNSYKFCEYGYDCRFNYLFDSKCYAQHFVYSLAYSDVYETFNYVKKEGFELGELKISINTITYVLNHMHEELVKLKNNNPENYKKYCDRKYTFRTSLRKNKQILLI
jgi:hypothetical protein